MKRRKSSFLAFISSLIPGAGEMYIGFMRRGLSIMLIFWGLILMAVWMNMDSLLFGIPVIWFYSFFETHNLRSMPEADLALMEDEYFLFLNIKTDKSKFLYSKYRNLFALVLIVIGFSILWSNMYDIIENLFPDYIMDILYSIGYYFPRLLIGCAIVVLGLKLIIVKKKELDLEELNMLEDKGGKLI